MKLVIDIPEEFLEDFNKDRFEDSLMRLSNDAHILAGRYEQEVATMLINAIKNGTPYEERPKGKWIEDRDKSGHLITRKCPICKAFHDGMIINFCPYCGADMRGNV